jgi:hypothetical protein
MQLTLKVNNRAAVKGAIGTRGILGAIINISLSPDREPSGEAFIHTFGLSEKSEWDAGKLSVGDKVEIRILPDGEADPPTSTRSLDDIPAALFANPTQAQQALKAAHICNEQLQGILRSAREDEPHHEALKIQRAIAALVQDLGKYLITPTLRRHPELLTEAKALDLIDSWNQSKQLSSSINVTVGW